MTSQITSAMKALFIIRRCYHKNLLLSCWLMEVAFAHGKAARAKFSLKPVNQRVTYTGTQESLSAEHFKRHPQLYHCVTVKGEWFIQSEEKPENYHCVIVHDSSLFCSRKLFRSIPCFILWQTFKGLWWPYYLLNLNGQEKKKKKRK